MSSIVDSHCHLDFNSFDNDRDEVIARSRAEGIERILNPGIDVASSQAAVKIAESFAEVYAACGVHPNEAMTWNDSTREEIRRIASHPKVRAIGEIGLDYYRDRAPRELQKYVFTEQLALASELELPVVIHCRDAFQDVLEMLAGWSAQLKARNSHLADRPGVLHSYSGELGAADEAIAMKFFIGVTGPVTFRNAENLRQTIGILPLTSLLVETDAPFLAPDPYRGKRNEPAYVRRVVEKIAEIKKMPVQIIAEQTNYNSIQLFNW